MTIKIFLTLILLSTYLFSSYQMVYIGKIDKYYENKVSYDELRIILDEIESTFESTLGVHVFDYSRDGKPIDILYLASSKLEKKFKRKNDTLKRKQDNIKALEEYFYINQEKIDILKDEQSYKNNIFNNKVNDLNEYVKEKNTHRLSKNEYTKVQKYVSTKKAKIKSELKVLKKEQRELKRIISKFNAKVISYNNKISQYNILSNELESMNRSFKKVKGKTFAQKKVTLKTYYKDGKKIEERDVEKTMNKIEIYGFDNLAELKVIIAHEIGHLVGLPHIQVEHALMNPILQKKQKEELFLSHEDILNFRDNF